MNWIDIKERLPEYEQNVLAFAEGYTPFVATFLRSYSTIDEDCWMLTYDQCYIFPEVTHWMPLPDKPE